MGNSRVTIENQDKKKERECVLIKFTAWSPKKEDWTRIELWIPTDTIPDFSDAFKSLGERKLFRRRPDLKEKRKTGEAIAAEKLMELEKQLEAYKKIGTGVLTASENCTSLYEESEKYLHLSINSENYRKKAIDYYESLKQTEDLYNSKICDYIKVFDAIKEDLACFAGCSSSDSYNVLFASMLNKKRHMSHHMLKNKDLLNKMTDIPAFPQYEEPVLRETDGQHCVEGDCVNVHKNTVERVRGLLEESEKTDPSNLRSMQEICSKWEQCIRELQEAKRYFEMGAEIYQKKKADYETKNLNYMEDAKRYLSEARKKAAGIRSHEKEWYYYRLLQLAYPLMKIICSQDDEIGPEMVVSLGRQTWELLDDFNEESGKYKYRWVTYSDEVCMESEDIRVDFIVGEASWPGLYIYSREHPEKLICVTPGHISAV